MKLSDSHDVSKGLGPSAPLIFPLKLLFGPLQPCQPRLMSRHGMAGHGKAFGRPTGGLMHPGRDLRGQQKIQLPKVPTSPARLGHGDIIV